MLDMLEESAMLRRPFIIELKNGQQFEDHVTDIAKWDGEDYVAFADHEFTPVRRIASMRRAWPIRFTYAGKH
ncbi:MAG: hypothetical protein ACTHU0_31935 [Kofleriaceae bacterium]